MNGYEIISESIYLQEGYLFKLFLRNPRHAWKRMVQKVSLWMKGGKLAPTAQLEISKINHLINIVQTKTNKIPPHLKPAAKLFGIDNSYLKNHKARAAS